MEQSLNNLIWFNIKNQKLTNEEWNDFCKRVADANLSDEVFKTSKIDYKQYLKDFLDGKYIIVRKED